MCVYVRFWRPCFVRSQLKSARTEEGLRKKLKNNAPGPLSRDRPTRKISRRRKRYTLQFIRTRARTSPV